MPVFRLDRRRIVFPPAELADDDGMLAIGGDLRPERLIAAYSAGIFPWFSRRGAPVWFSPDPRMILRPERLHVTRTLERTLRSGRFEISYDVDFEGVVRACAETPRAHEAGTWITEDFLAAYREMHRLGHAHSAEARRGGRLVGGLYGVALGSVFFGESMFFRERDASKAAFASLVRRLPALGVTLVDCQIPTPHLRSLGAEEVARSTFLRLVADGVASGVPSASWGAPPA